MIAQLRDYQQEMLERLLVAWKKHRSVMVQMPTGTGKTVLLVEVIRGLMAEDRGLMAGGVLIVAHRRELIVQIKETLEAFGMKNGEFEMRNDDDSGANQNARKVVVTSIQKLSRAEATGFLSTHHFSLVIIDEAHHALAKTYRMLWDRWPKAKFLGLTATPCRLSGEPFTELFDTLLQSWSIQEFIDKGWLSDFEYVSAAPDSVAMGMVAALDKRGADGDYQTKQMATVMDVPESIAHLFNTYKEFAEGKKGIVYAIDRQHAQHIAEYYQRQGVRAAVIDAKTPAEERRKIVARYKGHTDFTDCTDNNGLGERAEINSYTKEKESVGSVRSVCDKNLSVCDRIDVIVNVDIFSEGFDCPEVEFIQLARPTLSLNKYLQQVGRGMRISAGKDAVTILDNVGLYQTFGLPTDKRDWQKMFAGNMSGKGTHGGNEQPIIIREGENEKSLVNLEMVRIKRRGEKHVGIEVFMLGGKYGIMVDGKETCGAEYEHIHRIHDSNYFAIATYPYAVFKGKSTIISLHGLDLRAALYGKVTPHGDVFEGETLSGQRTYWDSVGQQYYQTRPEFEVIGGVQMIRKNGKYLPRRKTLYLREPVAKEQIWYNSSILWMKDILIVKKTGKIYPIKAYGNDCFYVESNDLTKGRYIRVGLNGASCYADMLNMMWRNVWQMPAWRNTQLIRASSGRMEFVDSPCR